MDLKPITLVLLPGMDGSGLLFTPFVRELPDWVIPVVVSYPPDRPLDYKGHLEIVMAALPTDQPFVLLGESFSGPLAIMAASRKPKGLCGVILCATFVSWPLTLPAPMARLIVSLGLFRLKSRRFFVRVLLSKGTANEISTLFSTSLAQQKPEVLAARAMAVIDVDCTAELHECGVPLLAMVADHDRIVAGRCMELIQYIRPDVETAHFNTPHLILQSEPEEAARVICGFLETVRGNIIQEPVLGMKEQGNNL